MLSFPRSPLLKGCNAVSPHPDEVAILTADGSLTTAIKLGSTSKSMMEKLRGAHLRVETRNCIFAICAERHSAFHVKEVTWAPLVFRINHLRTLCLHLPHLQIIWISMLPAKSHAEGMDKVWQLHANFVKVYGLQAWMDLVGSRVLVKPRVLTCVSADELFVIGGEEGEEGEEGEDDEA